MRVKEETGLLAERNKGQLEPNGSYCLLFVGREEWMKVDRGFERGRGIKAVANENMGNSAVGESLEVMTEAEVVTEDGEGDKETLKEGE